MAHVFCILDTYGYKCTLTICNTHCFSTTTMVARTHDNVTLYVRTYIACPVSDGAYHVTCLSLLLRHRNMSVTVVKCEAIRL